MDNNINFMKNSKLSLNGQAIAKKSSNHQIHSLNNELSNFTLTFPNNSTITEKVLQDNSSSPSVFHSINPIIPSLNAAFINQQNKMFYNQDTNKTLINNKQSNVIDLNNNLIENDDSHFFQQISQKSNDGYI